MPEITQLSCGAKETLFLNCTDSFNVLMKNNVTTALQQLWNQQTFLHLFREQSLKAKEDTSEPTQEHVCCDANTLRSDTKRIIRRVQRRQSGDRETNKNAHVVKAGTKWAFEPTQQKMSCSRSQQPSLCGPTCEALALPLDRLAQNKAAYYSNPCVNLHAVW